MAADAFCVIGIDIAACGSLVFPDLKYGILRAENHTVVAFEAATAAHAAAGLGHGLLFGEACEPLLEVAQYILCVEVDLCAPVHRFVLEVTEEHLFVLDDLAEGTVFEIVHSEVGFVGTAYLAVVVLAWLKFVCTQFREQVEMVDVDLGSLA